MTEYSNPQRGISALLAAIVAFGGLAMAEGEYQIDGMVFGMPPAQVFQEEYAGPPVVGDTLTLLPEIASLDYEGNVTHEIRIDTLVQEIEIAPGVRYNAWTYGGSVPGPVLHVREGDRIVYRMANRTDEELVIAEPTDAGSPFMQQIAASNYQNAAPAIAPMPHSMDFHSGTVAANDKWRSIAPGETIEFEWVANYPGVYIYHCSTPMVLMHVAMGQYGVVVVSPRDGFPTDDKVDREFAVVQSDFYLSPGAGGLHQFDAVAAFDKRASHVLFNGHRNVLSDQPLEANAGERVRIYFLNAGPSLTSTFHVIGAIFDTVYYEGSPENVQRGVQSVLLGAGMGAVVEFIVPEEGEYYLVDHEFADKEKGAIGVLRVGPRQAE
jgi:nitrite reductase (NO-forming)